MVRLAHGEPESLRCHQCANLWSNVRHGHYVGGIASPTYRSWSGMLSRCRSAPNGSDHWKRYGARGITYCNGFETFEGFLECMGERPEGLSIDLAAADAAELAAIRLYNQRTGRR